MIVYRIAQEQFADKLQASGASNRWNKAGQYVIYTSESISLCALELLAHTNGIRPKGVFKVMHIEIQESVDIAGIGADKLPIDWHGLAAYPFTQKLGSEWYESRGGLVMKIPSAIIQSEWNYIINTAHPEFEKKSQLIKTEDFYWDSRFPED
ncbi:MAG: RES family NAD+ phosphorylase [Cyclobacteriaceae bacterium]